MADRLSQLVEQALADLDADDDVKDAIKEAIDFKELVEESIAEGGDVKDVVVRFIIATINNLDPDDGDWFTDMVNEDADILGPIIRELLEGDDDVKNALKKRMRKLILKEIEELGENDDYDEGIRGKINEALIDENSGEGMAVDKIQSMIESDEKVLNSLEQRLKIIILNQIEEMGNEWAEDIGETIQNEFDLEVIVKAALAKTPDLNSKVAERIEVLAKEWIANLSIEDSNLHEFLKDSETIKSAINQALKDLTRPEGNRQLIVDVIRSMVANKDEMQPTLVNAISEVLVNRLAEGIINVALGDKSGRY